MEQPRFLLALVLSFLVYFLWNAFFVIPQEKANAPAPGVTISSEQPVTAAEPAPVIPVAAEPVPEVVPSSVPARTLTVNTPFYTARFSEKGAVLKSLVLNNYRENIAPDAPLKELIAPDMSDGSIWTGFSGGGMPDLRDVTFSADMDGDTLDVRDAARELVFSWTSPQGIVMEKRFTFAPDTWLIGMNTVIRNRTSQPLRGNLSVSLTGHAPKEASQYGFEGPSALIDNDLEQIQIKDIKDKNSYTGKVTWTAVETRYFMGALVPAEPVDAQMHLEVSPENILENRYVSPETLIAAGADASFAFHLFFGPKSLKILKQVNNDLSRVVYFGWFDILAKPCLWLMNAIYSKIPNYGVAIILLTIIIKALLWPLGNKSYKSMHDMKKLQPLMTEIREKYKDDKAKMNEEIMSLYRIYKVNPMGGCLPMVLQIPVFFALYRMLYEAIELRHAPFFGWITDLSAPDRLFHFKYAIPFMEPPYGLPVLTIIMGATMIIQQKMSPPPGDPAQAKMMMFMPVVFTFIFINFSSGLVLYWLVSNIISITQQYYVSKQNN